VISAKGKLRPLGLEQRCARAQADDGDGDHFKDEDVGFRSDSGIPDTEFGRNDIIFFKGGVTFMINFTS
jgi:hypothetical protein